LDEEEGELQKFIPILAVTAVVATLFMLFSPEKEPIVENITLEVSSSSSSQKQNSNISNVSIEYSNKSHKPAVESKKVVISEPVIEESKKEAYVAIYSGEGVELKDEKVPMKLLIGSKSIDITLPLAKVENPKSCSLIIQDKNGKEIAKLDPSFVNHIDKNQKVRVDYIPETGKITGVYINDNTKKVLKPAPQVGDLPNFNYN